MGMGKDEKVHFTVAVLVYNMEMQPTSAHMNLKGQGHSGLNIFKVLFS